MVQKNLGADLLARCIAEQTDDAGAPWGEMERVRLSKGFRGRRLVRGSCGKPGSGPAQNTGITRPCITPTRCHTRATTSDPYRDANL